MTTRLRGLLAALLLAATTIGLPLALAVTAGNPLHALGSLRAGQLSDTDMIAVLAAVFWLAWITFTIPVLVETVTAVAARLTHRPAGAVRLPLLGAQQHLARQLISAVLLLFPAATSALSATTVSASHPITATPTAWTAPAHAHVANEAARETGQEGRVYRVPDGGGMRSYWALAEHYLGDGTRWREIWHLNEGRTHRDGSVMDTPRQLHAGWTVLLPPAAALDDIDDGSPVDTHEVRVAPGDTLSGLAADDGINDWHRAWQLNAERPEPDHQRYTDPDLIRPGWTLTLPGAPTPASTARPPRSAAADPPRGDHPEAPPTVAGVPLPATDPSDPPPEPDTGSPTPAATATPSRAHASDARHHQLPTVPLEIGLAAAATVAALDRARRIAQRRRRVGHRPLPPPPELVAAEAEIRRDARRAHPTIAAIELAAAMTGTHPVTVHTVIARTDGAVDLQLTEPTSPPPPFLTVEDGWRLPAGADAFSYALNPNDLDDPCPALIPIGHNVEGQILVNLAATGPVTIAGAPDAVDGYLRGTIEALLGAPWASRLHIHLPQRLADRLPVSQRLTFDDRQQPTPATEAPRETSDLAGEEEPGWRTTPIHLYCGWTATADLEAVLSAAADSHRHIHFIGCGAVTGAATWILDGDQLIVPAMNETVTVTAASPADSSATDLLHHTATAPDLPIGDPRLPDLTPPLPEPTDGDGEVTGERDQSKRLLLLGPVELTDTGRLRRGQTINLLTYLAMHPRGVDRHQLLAALWPDQVPSPQTMRNRISETRALVNGGITDGPIWRLTDAITTDWAQFTALAKGGIDDQRRALRLVRGRPFAGLDDADWIDLEGFRSEVEATIVDVALTVADDDLANGNYPGALDAARSGLSASRYEERLHRAAIRAATAQGLQGIAKTLQQEMRTALDLDIEPDEQIQAESLALLNDVRERRLTASDSSRG